MIRLICFAVFLLASMVTGDGPRADERSESMALLREALGAVERADAAASPEDRLRALERAAAAVARLTRDYASTYVGLRLATGQAIGALDPRALERRLAEMRSSAAAPAPTPRASAPARSPVPAAARPCERGPIVGVRPGEAGTTLAEVIADCRSALAFEPGSPRWRYQLARALSERAQPGEREEAVRLLEAAAADGWTPAKAELCARYLWGIGTAKDPGRARLLCEAAAAEGNEPAKTLLAQMAGLTSPQR